MALALPTPCTQPGCPALVKGGGRCPSHRVGMRPAQVKANHPRRVYDTALWKRLRDLLLAAEPCCRACALAGRIELAVCVDHIIDVAAGGEPFKTANLQPLCESCHNRKTALTLRFGRKGYPGG